MNLDGLIHEVAATIRPLYQIGNTPVFEQDLDDVAQSIENIAKTDRCIIVKWNGCDHVATGRPDGDARDKLYVQANLVVSVYENPSINRIGGGSHHLLGMAAEIAKALNGLGTEDMDEGLHFVSITPIEQLAHGVITCDVVFRTKNSI